MLFIITGMVFDLQNAPDFFVDLSSIVRVISVHLSKYGQLTWATGNAYRGI